VDRNVLEPGRPYYQQIADDLRARIRSSELTEGDPLPSARALAEWWGVSVMTVRNAIAVLQREGLLLGHQGKNVQVIRQDNVLRVKVTGAGTGEFVTGLAQQIVAWADAAGVEVALDTVGFRVTDTEGS
jgi:DNA-binding GntR family transcriptional regulator